MKLTKHQRHQVARERRRNLLKLLRFSLRHRQRQAVPLPSPAQD